MGTERRRVEAALVLVSDRVAAGEAARLPELAPQLAELMGPKEETGKPPRDAPAR
ncbi:hypothetical protein D3C83_215510 [compost metagenome]